MSRVFINYRRQDSEGYVGRLYDHLVQHFERDDVFMDVDNIAPGADFIATLENAVAGCDVLIAVIGPHWLTITGDDGSRRLDQWNDFVRVEIASALKHGKLVIPVLVGQARMPAPGALPDDIAALARRNAVEISHNRFSYDAGRLVDAIKNALRGGNTLKPPADPHTLARKEAAINALRAELVNATDSPLYSFRVQNRALPVLGQGSPDASMLFVGESPGKYEAERGVPFCGPSGDVFDELLESITLRREDVFLTNIVLDRPPEKRDPTPQEIAFYGPYTDRLIAIIEPRVIVPLGRFAMEYILKKFDLPGKRGRISQLHGKLLEARMAYGPIHVIPMYHPAVVLYSASKRDTLLEDFTKLRPFV
ncbi:MAG: TIR domain-containing protein [Anaerolineae bacterium]|nr:TIR domain-containing protein [Anaerolineae bacterium]